MAKKDRIQDLITTVGIKFRDEARRRNASNKAALDEYVASITPKLIAKAKKKYPIPKQAIGRIIFQERAWGPWVTVKFEIKNLTGRLIYECSVFLEDAETLKMQARVDLFYRQNIDTMRNHHICESIAAKLYMSSDDAMQENITTAINDYFSPRPTTGKG